MQSRMVKPERQKYIIPHRTAIMIREIMISGRRTGYELKTLSLAVELYSMKSIPSKEKPMANRKIRLNQYETKEFVLFFLLFMVRLGWFWITDTGAGSRSAEVLSS